MTNRRADALLVVNADDMGLALGVNRGIEEAVRGGFVRSVSVMAAGEAFEDAAARIRALGEVGVGVHLVGTMRRPVLPPDRLPGLVGRDGRLVSTPARLVASLVRGKARMDDLEAELSAQVERAADSGLRLDHLDCHLGLHALPPILDAVVRIARAHAIPFVRRLRVLSAGRLFGFALNPRHLLHTVVAVSTSPFLGPRLARAEGVRTSDALYGLSSTVDASGQIRRLLDSVRPGLTEFFCHPGRADESTLALPYRYPGWESELEAVLDPELLGRAARRGIRLVSYREVA